jgi:hypothetical protein
VQLSAWLFLPQPDGPATVPRSTTSVVAAPSAPATQLHTVPSPFTKQNDRARRVSLSEHRTMTRKNATETRRYYIQKSPSIRAVMSLVTAAVPGFVLERLKPTGAGGVMSARVRALSLHGSSGNQAVCIAPCLTAVFVLSSDGNVFCHRFGLDRSRSNLWLCSDSMTRCMNATMRACS